MANPNINISVQTLKNTVETFHNEMMGKISGLEKLLSDLQLQSPSETADKNPKSYDWTIDESSRIIVATDGSSKTIDGISRASYAVAFGPIGHPLNTAAPIYGTASIFHAELQAIARALQEASKHGHRAINIVIDSASALKFAQEIILYADNTHLTQALSDEYPEIKKIIKEIKDAKKHFEDIMFTKIRSHTDNEGPLFQLNEAADILAQQVLHCTFSGFDIPTRITEVSIVHLLH